MPSTPLVSVVIPTYNRAPFLAEAIESVLGQSFTEYEILVADDGSTDDTADRLARYGARTRHIRLDHSGRPSVARNRALAVARGELIAFLDDDDVWQPEKLERQVHLLVAQPDLGMVYTDLRFLREDGTRSAPILQPHQKRRGNLFDDLLADCFIHPSTTMVRKCMGDEVGWFDEDLECIEDFDLWLRLTYRSRVGFLNAPLVLVRRHDAGISTTRNVEVWHSMAVVLDKVSTDCKLSARQRLRVRQSRARAHTRLATLVADGRRVDRRELIRALRFNPLLPSAWRALFGSYLGR